MPKIVINEYDLTKAGTGEYENFSVVVPGFVGDNCDETVFDDNGIYECSSQTDFVNYIGKKSAEVTTGKVLVEAKAPTIDFAIKLCPNNTKPILLVADDPTAPVQDQKIIEYQYNSVAGYEAAFAALIAGNFNIETGEATADEPTTTRTYGLYYTKPNTTGKVGHLRDINFQYIEVNSQEEADGAATYATYPSVTNKTLEIMPLNAVASHDAYYVIQAGDEAEDTEGKDGLYVEDRITHYGNQMAYELLGLGYTVLFKKISELDEDRLNQIIYKKDEATGKFIEDENGHYVLDTDSELLKQDGDSYILNAEASAAICALADPNFWECLRDKSMYDFRYLVTGLLTGNDAANTCMLSIADHSAEVLLDDASIKDGRGDCIALIDLDCKAYVNKTQTQAIPYLAKEAAKWSSAYAAVFAPYVTYILADDAAYNNNKTFPASFHYLACAANSSNNNFAEWYANAGYTRGVSKYTIESTGCKLGEIAVQSLEPRFLLNVGKELNEEGTAYNDINTTVAINLIIKIKSSYYLWGNRTGKKLGTRGAADGDLVAQHFLNIRQLCTTIKKQVYTTCRRLTFDPNSNSLWINFRGLLSPMLEQMKADQGIRDYEFVRDYTDRKALLKARIRIVPIEAVEDFEIGLYLEDNLEDVVLTEA